MVNQTRKLDSATLLVWYLQQVTIRDDERTYIFSKTLDFFFSDGHVTFIYPCSAAISKILLFNWQIVDFRNSLFY